jgi:multidrug resistance efflux pump
MEKRWVMLILVATALLGCGRSPTPTRAPIATALPPAAAAHSRSGIVVASGEVVPAQVARLSFALAGHVQTVAVGVGDEVKQGDPLVTLETVDLDANVAQAEAALAVAQASLAQVEAKAREEEIAAAEEPIAAAQASLEGAEASLARILAGASEREIEIARLTWEQAKDALWAAQAERDGIAGSALSPGYAVDAAEAAVRSAEMAVKIAELQYQLAKEGPTDQDVRIAQAQVDAAEAQVEQAKAQLALLLAGPSAEAINVAKAQVQQAQAALDAARAALRQTTLRAPFAGTVGTLAVSAGEIVLPGQMVLIVADLNHLQVETFDLSERDVVEVAVGQQATVYVEALNSDLTGRVVSIQPQANKMGGDVVYTVVVELDEQPPNLRWGMSAEVEIATS